jgi:hypothetical protein
MEGARDMIDWIEELSRGSSTSEFQYERLDYYIVLITKACSVIFSGKMRLVFLIFVIFSYNLTSYQFKFCKLVSVCYAQGYKTNKMGFAIEFSFLIRDKLNYIS